MADIETVSGGAATTRTTATTSNDQDKPQVPDIASSKDASDNQEPVYSVFSPLTKLFLTYFLGFALILSTMTATIYFPLIPMLSHELGVSILAINLTVTVYAVVQALSPGVFASLADCYGRRPVLLGLASLYAVASLGLSLGYNRYAVLVVLRALQSLSGSPLPPLGYGVAADIAPVSERGSVLGPLLATCNGISAAGPLIGGAVAQGTSGARWVFLALLLIAVSCLVIGGLFMPETARYIVGNGSKPATGIWRTWWSLLRRRGSIPETENSKREGIQEERKSWRPGDALNSLRIILFKDAALVLWVIASTYSVYCTFQVTAPVIFADVYGYNELQIGLASLPGLVGMTLGGIIAGRLQDRNYKVTAKELGVAEPEKSIDSHRNFPLERARYRNFLWYVLFEAVLIIGFGWAVRFNAHPACPIVLQFFICLLSTLQSHTASSLLVELFPDSSSTAYASSQITRCGLSAAFAAVVQPLIDVVGRGWLFTMFGLFVGVTSGLSVLVTQVRGMKWRQARRARELEHKMKQSGADSKSAVILGGSD